MLDFSRQKCVIQEPTGVFSTPSTESHVLPNALDRILTWRDSQRLQESSFELCWASQGCHAFIGADATVSPQKDEQCCSDSAGVSHSWRPLGTRSGKRLATLGPSREEGAVHETLLSRVRLLRAFNLFKKDHHSSAPSSLSAQSGGGGEG